jgi:peptide/nickel transport system substrate-binding protein
MSRKRIRTGATRTGFTALAIGIVVAMSLATAAFAQSSSPSASGGSEPLTFTYADVAPPSSLNPMVGYLGTDYVIWALNYDIPINFSTKDFSPDYQHSIVTSVDASSDGMTFTYHMRSGMKWSDGQPFTAKDVAWTLNYYKKNNVPNYSSDLSLMEQNGATATDDTTFVLKTSKPTSFYSGNSVFLYEYILPEHIWGKYENDYKAAKQVANTNPQEAVGSGPFIITKYVKNQYVQMDRNPYYWGDSVGMTPHVDRIVYQIFGNQDAEAAALQSGSVDFGYFSTPSILNTLKQRGLDTQGATIPSFSEIGINTGSAYQTNPTGGFVKHGDGALALTDVVVRQAIRRAIDSSTLVSRVMQGYATVADSPVQPGATTGDWNPGPNDPDLSFNIQAANQMLDQAGYTMGPNNIRIDPHNNQPLEFRFYSRASDQPSIDIVPYVQDWLKQIGIKIDPQTLSSNKLGNVILAGDYDMFEWGWFPNPDPNYILNIFTCQQRPPNPNTYRNSDSYYCNPQYDKLFAQQESTTDANQRDQIVHEMQSILYRDQPYIMLWYDQSLQAHTTKWTGFVSQPSQDGDWLATYGPLSFISVRPVTATSGTSGGGGVSPWVWVALAVILVAIVVVVVVMRSRRSEEDEA